jgi:hypothetical protein
MTEDKLIFIGTAGDCSVVGKQLRASGGIILQTRDSQFHLDPGPGSIVRALQYGINLRNNTALLISNNSIERSNDINAVIHAMTISGLDKKGVLISNNVIINGDKDTHPVLSKFHRTCLERAIALEHGKKVGVEDIEIQALPTTNPFPNALGYKLITEGCIISYTGDTGYSHELLNNYKDSDILIINLHSPGSKSGKLLCSSDAIKIISKTKPKLAIITNFGLELLKADPIYEARIIQRETGIQTISAKDGMTINTSSFSAKVRQRTLNSYTPPDVSKSSVNLEIKEITDITDN